ncbi:MAG: hypothetical protein ACRDVM_02710 [Acidimicrobiia bacterium]
MSNNHPDAFELLRRNDPVQVEDLPGPDGADAQALKQRILATPRQEWKAHRLPTGRRRLAVALAIGLVAALSIAAAWYLTREVTRPSVTCYQQPSLASDRVGIGSPEILSAAECVEAWQSRTLVNPTVAQPGEVPPLTACVNEVGAVAVFPTGDSGICERLGLALPEPASVERQQPILELREALVDYFAARGCVPVDLAEEDVEALLVEAGFSEWRVEAMPTTAERPCASFSLESEAQTIRIVPIPRPPED